MFKVEDGTGLVDSTSYVAVSWADTYFADRGNTTWSDATNDDKEIALIKATDYADAMYAFVGVKASGTQALEWPRDEAYDRYSEALTGIPTVLMKAITELAVRAVSADLLDDADFSGRVKRERVEGAVEVEYVDDGVFQQKSYTYIDKLLITTGLARGKNGSTGQLKIIRV
jgi:hypothetical protein